MTQEKTKKVFFKDQTHATLLKSIQDIMSLIKSSFGYKKKWFDDREEPLFFHRDLHTPEDDHKKLETFLIKEVAQKINNEYGDGMKTALLLFHSMIKDGFNILQKNVCPHALQKGIDKAVNLVIQKVQECSSPISSLKDFKHIALTASSGNQSITEAILHALEEVKNPSKIVIIQENIEEKYNIEIVEAMEILTGYISPYFCNNTKKMTSELTNAHILIIDGTLTNVYILLPILQEIASQKKELLIITKNIDQELLSTLVLNKITNILKICVAKINDCIKVTPHYLEDIALMTGATVINPQDLSSQQSISLDVLGFAKKIFITKENTLCLGNGGNSTLIEEKINEITQHISHQEPGKEKEQLLERKNRFMKHIAVISIGTALEREIDYHECFHSLCAVQESQQNGFVAGGGIALYFASHVLDNTYFKDDEDYGKQIVQAACKIPLKQLIFNTGYDFSAVEEELMDYNDPHMGFNVQEERIENLVDAGIIDATNIVISSLKQAAHVANKILLSNALIYEHPQQEKEQ